MLGLGALYLIGIAAGAAHADTEEGSAGIEDEEKGHGSFVQPSSAADFKDDAVKTIIIGKDFMDEEGVGDIGKATKRLPDVVRMRAHENLQIASGLAADAEKGLFGEDSDFLELLYDTVAYWDLVVHKLEVH